MAHVISLASVRSRPKRIGLAVSAVIAVLAGGYLWFSAPNPKPHDTWHPAAVAAAFNECDDSHGESAYALDRCYQEVRQFFIYDRY